MYALKYIFTSPLGWALAIVHWIFVAFAFLGDQPYPSGFGVHTTTGLMFYLALLDFPALSLARFAIGLYDASIPITPLGLVIILIMVTVQWLLVGTAISKAYHDYRRDTPTNGDGAVNLS